MSATRFSQFLDWLSTPHNQRALAVTRTLLGILMVYIYTINYAHRHFLLGPNGIYPYSERFNLFYTTSPLVFEITYFLAIVAAICFALGLGGRITTFVNWLFFWSWSNATWVIGDGGDNLLRIMLFYMLFTDLYGALKPNSESLWQRCLAIVHNAGLAAIGVQISYLYLTSALMKVQGTMWQNGTALYYVLQVDEFRNPAIADLLIANPLVIVLITYFATLYQVAFPWLLLSRAKPLAVILGASFHIGILLAMNLVSFSLIMVSIEIGLLRDADIEWVSARIRGIARRVWGLLRPAVGKSVPLGGETR